MAKQYSSGFTIIEIMLFLAITGLMLIGILASSGNSVNRQRYIDTVYSVQSTLQDQYTEVINTRNSSASSSICTGSSQARGQSNCVLLGKRVTSSADDKTISVDSIYGTTPSSVLSTDTDTTVLNRYNPQTVPNSTEDYSLEWGVSMQNSAKQPLAFTLFILRSPKSGSIRTYLVNSSNAIFSAAYSTNTLLTNALLICLDDGGTIGLAGRMGVKVIAGASSTTAVQLIGDGTSVASGGCA